MQAINVAAINPWFMTALFGTAAACAVAVVAAIAGWDGSYGPYLLAGGALYLVGTIGVTLAANVPRNESLAALAPAAAEAAGHWARYLTQWTAWNHVRAAAALVAAAALTAGLL